MAVEVYTFSINVPRGGTAAKPQIFNLPMRIAEVDGVEVYVPAGGNGQLWFALGAAGTPTLPTNQGGYILLNNDTIKWPLEHQIDSGAWQLFAYNTGTVSHLIHIRFLLTPPGLNASITGAQFIDNLTIEYPGDGGGGISGGGGGGGNAYTFTLELPLSALTVAPGGAGVVTILVDELGTRPGAYSVTFAAVPAGITLTANTPATPTALPVAATANSSVKPGSYTATVTVANAGITQTATLPLTVAVAGGGGGGGGTGTATITSSQSTVVAGSQLGVIGTGWASGELVTVVCGVASATFAANDSGVLNGGLPIPASMSTGTYTLSATGTLHSATGPAVTVTAAAGGGAGKVALSFNNVYNHLKAGQPFSFTLTDKTGHLWVVEDPNYAVLGNMTATGGGTYVFDNGNLVINTAGQYTYYAFDNNYSVSHLVMSTTLVVE